MGDGTVLTRQAGKGGNLYYRNKLKFAAVGTSIPIEIEQALNFKDVNLQLQLDSPFLLSESPGEVARYFNKIAHIDQIDIGLKKIQSQINNINATINADKDEEARIKSDLEQYEYLNTAEAELEVLEDMQSRFEQTCNFANKLSGIILSIEKVNVEITDKSEEIKDEAVVNSALQLYILKDRAEDEYDELSSLIQRVYDTDNEIKKVSQVLKLDALVDNLINLKQVYEQIIRERDKLSALYSVIEDTHFEADSLLTQLKGWEYTFKTEKPDVCPLCNQRIKK